eukprot:scaffold28540_cov27-Tisochrysis_lutea.AAC.1
MLQTIRYLHGARQSAYMLLLGTHSIPPPPFPSRGTPGGEGPARSVFALFSPLRLRARRSSSTSLS